MAAVTLLPLLLGMLGLAVLLPFLMLRFGLSAVLPGGLLVLLFGLGLFGFLAIGYRAGTVPLAVPDGQPQAAPALPWTPLAVPLATQAPERVAGV